MKIIERNKEIKKIKHSNDYSYEANVDSNIDSFEKNEKLDNIIKISGNQEIYNEIKSETKKIKEFLSHNKEKLNIINLYENQKSEIDIYQWDNLFKRSIPITSYVSSSKLIKMKNDKKEDNKKGNNNKESSLNMNYPIALVDLDEEEIKKYLPSNPNGVPSLNVVRFQKIPLKGNPKDSFYFSNSFNDYYKMDFKDFVKIMPVLKSKKRCVSVKLSSEIKKVRKKNVKEEQKREIYKNLMLNKLNNLYIEKQYLSLSENVNNIQPLMSSIHAQIHPDEEDYLTKDKKKYIKTNKPLGSERNISSIDFTVNERHYHRNEINKFKLKKRKSKSSIRKLFLPKYDINDPDIAIFKRIEYLEKIINKGNNNNFNGNKFKEKKPIINDKEENNKKNNAINNYKLINREKRENKVRAESAKRENKKLEEFSKNNKKLTRAMSAHEFHPISRQNEYNIYKLNLSLNNKYNKFDFQKVFEKNYNKRILRNKSYDLFEENKKWNSSSQISTFEEINSSIYEKQNFQRYGIPFKNNYKIQSKIYLKINQRIKEKQYKKVQKKLEEFSKLIHLDDELLSEDILKEKIEKKEKKNSKNNSQTSKKSFHIDKNKIFKRPFSSYIRKNRKNEQIKKKEKRNSKNKINYDKLIISKVLFRNNNNFKFGLEKSSKNNSKMHLNTSALNTKNENFVSNKNDNVTLVYFNDFIEMKPQKINELKPIIKNDGIMAPNYFSRSKPYLLNRYSKLKANKYLSRVKSDKNLGPLFKLKNNKIK